MVGYKVSRDVEERLHDFTVENSRKVMCLGNYDDAFLVCLPIVIAPGLDIEEECVRRNFEERMDPKVDEECGIWHVADSFEVYALEGFDDWLVDCQVFTQNGKVLKEKEYLKINEIFADCVWKPIYVAIALSNSEVIR
jgi:hypothetical protein